MDTTYISSLMEEFAFPSEATAILREAGARVDGGKMQEALSTYTAQKWSYDGMPARMEEMAKAADTHAYTVAMLFLLSACKELESRYAARGYSRDLFIETMTDLRYKLLECQNVYGVWGIFVADWYTGFMDMTRFTVGRFQYEFETFPHGTCTVDGCVLKTGDTVLNLHIPASGVPLSDGVRMASYRAAAEFFYPGRREPIPFVCQSWLLFPGYEDYIPAHLNIKRFRDDFTVVHAKEYEKFEDAWRVFGADAEKPAAALPRNTSQERLFADYCATGKKHGNGYGVFFLKP